MFVLLAAHNMNVVAISKCHFTIDEPYPENSEAPLAGLILNRHDIHVVGSKEEQTLIGFSRIYLAEIISFYLFRSTA